jgi:excisionase family DNA binding protein
MKDLSTWIPKQDAVSRLGYSERTLERKIRQLKLRTAQMAVPGRPPITVIHPADFERLQGATVPAAAVVESGEMVVRTPPRVTLELPPEVVASLPRERPLWLTLKESAAYTGLPQAHLRRLIAEEKLTAIVAGGWKIRRKDLEAL